MIYDILDKVPPKGSEQRYDPNCFDPNYDYGGMIFNKTIRLDFCPKLELNYDLQDLVTIPVHVPICLIPLSPLFIIRVISGRVLNNMPRSIPDLDSMVETVVNLLMVTDSNHQTQPTHQVQKI